MSITLQKGYTDTPIPDVSAPSITLPVINYKADFRIKQQTSKDVTLVNLTSPLNQTETIRFGYSEVPDIYSKSGINSELITGVKSGVNILAQVNQIVKATNTNGNSVSETYLPLSAHLVIKAPKTGDISADDVLQLVTRLVGALYQDGTANLSALLRGAIAPSGL